MARAGTAVAIALVLWGVPAAAYQLDDSLKGSTVGNPVGGSIGPDGWTVTSRTDVLWYAIPTLSSGAIEFTVTNLTTAGLITGDNELFAMYEDSFGMGEPISYGYFRDNFDKCMLRVYGPDDATRVGQQKLMWGICNGGDPGYGTCPCASSFFDEPFGGDGNWDGSPQRLRIEWGGGHARYLRNGGLVLDIDYSGSGLGYGPVAQHFSLGTSRAAAVGTAGMPAGIVFSDVSVTGTEAAPEPVCTPAPPDAGAAGAGGGGGSSGCGAGPEITADLSPASGSGTAQSFTASYHLCEGAAAFRVAELWVADSATAGAIGPSVGYEAGRLYGAGATGDCAPGDATTLQGTYGALDCQHTTVATSGDTLTVVWAMQFNPSTFAGTHGVWLDAKGGTATPEPRLGWTKLGDYTVAGSGGSSWTDGGNPDAATTGGTGGAGEPPRGSTAAGSDGGCGCHAGERGAPAGAWLALFMTVVAAVSRRRRSRS